MNGNDKSGSGNSPIGRTERGAEAFTRAARHSRRVRVLKIILPVVAVVASGLLLGYSYIFSFAGGKVDPGSMSIESGNLVMDNPSLDGFTSDNLPYHMTATRARQAIGGDTSAIALEDINATVPISKDNQASIQARTGTFDRQSNRLTLKDAVTVRTTSGMFARLESAQVDVASSSLTTDEPVEIVLEGMSVRADTFRASGGGDQLVFQDRVRVEINPKRIRSEPEQGETAGED